MADIDNTEGTEGTEEIDLEEITQVEESEAKPKRQTSMTMKTLSGMTPKIIQTKAYLSHKALTLILVRHQVVRSLV